MFCFIVLGSELCMFVCLLCLSGFITSSTSRSPAGTGADKDDDEEHAPDASLAAAPAQDATSAPVAAAPAQDATSAAPAQDATSAPVAAAASSSSGAPAQDATSASVAAAAAAPAQDATASVAAAAAVPAQAASSGLEQDAAVAKDVDLIQQHLVGEAIEALVDASESFVGYSAAELLELGEALELSKLIMSAAGALSS
jgi:cytoskeletal protein RodZ